MVGAPFRLDSGMLSCSTGLHTFFICPWVMFVATVLTAMQHVCHFLPGVFIPAIRGLNSAHNLAVNQYTIFSTVYCQQSVVHEPQYPSHTIGG